jgi:hypothetical protein
MTAEVRYLLSMVCILPTLVGLWRYKKIDPPCRLLVYMLLLDAINETIVFIGVKYAAFESIATLCSNIYMLVTLVLFLSFVTINGYINKKLQQYLMAIALMVAAYNWYHVGTPYKDFYFLLCFLSSVMLFISINILSKQVMAVNTSLNRNFWFWVSSLFVVQSAYALLIFGLYVFSMFETANGKAIGVIFSYVNAGCYLLFIIAILRMPKRKTSYTYQTS